MCRCIDVQIQSYDNQVTLHLPTFIASYYSQPRDTICVDICCVEDVSLLWAHGIPTFGCCCGHNLKQGFINVGPQHFKAALRLGFKKYVFGELNGGPNREDTVMWPRNIETANLRQSLYQGILKNEKNQ